LPWTAGIKPARIKRKIGLVPQEVSVYYDFTVKQNIDYFCGLYINNGAERKKLVKAIYRLEYTKTVSRRQSLKT